MISEVIKMFSSWADLARREGLLALESKDRRSRGSIFEKWINISN